MGGLISLVAYGTTVESLVVSIRTTCFKIICNLPTRYICVFRSVLTIKSIVTWDNTVSSSRTSQTVSEDYTASIFRIEEYDMQIASKKQAASETNALRTAGHTIY
jgi:hypothetical protein